MFLRILILALLLPGLMSCGRGITAAEADRGNFEPYFQKFEAYSADMGRPTFGDDAISIQFGFLKENEAGRCEWHFFKGRVVLIDHDKWEAFDEESREALILHELGHCILRREHDEHVATIPDVRGAAAKDPDAPPPTFVGPKSIMNPTSLQGTIFRRNHDYYVKELFGALP